jgi:hypothetical protein
MVNQRNEFDHNHCVSARNEFADNSCTNSAGLRRACRMRGLPPPRASGVHLPAPGTVRARRICRLWPIIESRKEKTCGRAAGRLPTDFVAPAARRNSSFGRTGKSGIDWFRTGDAPISARLGGFRRRAAARRCPPLRDILVAAAVDMSKRRIRRGPPAHKAAQLPAFSVHLAGRITPCGASSVRRENLLIFASVALIRRFARRGRRQRLNRPRSVRWKCQEQNRWRSSKHGISSNGSGP